MADFQIKGLTIVIFRWLLWPLAIRATYPVVLTG